MILKKVLLSELEKNLKKNSERQYTANRHFLSSAQHYYKQWDMLFPD